MEKIHKMIEENLKLVPYIVYSKFKGDISKHHDLLDEYIAVGNEALIKACQRFDESKGYQFATYATPIIWSEIQKFRRYGRNTLRLPPRLHKAGTEYGKGKTLDKDIDTICEESGINKKDIEEWLTVKDIVNLDTPIRDPKDEGSNSTILDTIAGDCNIEEYVLDDIKYKEKMEILEKVLNPQEFEVVKLVETGIYKQKDIAKAIGLSQSRVSRILRNLTEEVGPALDKYYHGEISLQEFCKTLKIGEEIFMSFNKEIEVISKWLINNPGEELNLGKVLKEEGMDRSTYVRTKIKNKVYKKMREEGYNIKEVPYGARGTRLVLLDSEEIQDNSSKSVSEIETTDKNNILLNILDIPITNCDLEFTETLQKSLSMFTILGKTAVLDIRVREVS